MKHVQGFTLVELLASIAILGVIVMSVGAILPSLTRVNRVSTQDQATVLAARAYFEQVRSELRNNFDASLSAVSIPGNNQNGLSCATTESAKFSTTVTTLKVSRTVNMSCTTSGRTTTFKLTVVNPELGKV